MSKPYETIRVCIIDDSSVEIQLTTLLLQRSIIAPFAGNFTFQTTSFSSAEAYLNTKKSKESREFDIILLDNIMQDSMDGKDAIFEIRKTDPDIPVIMLTADDSLEVCRQFFVNGGDDFLLKPVDPDVLHYKIIAMVKNTRFKAIKKQKDEILQCVESWLQPLNELALILYNNIGEKEVYAKARDIIEHMKGSINEHRFEKPHH